MKYRIGLYIIILIFSVLGCKNAAENNEPIQEVEVADIPERPSEIEVIDLTNDVELFVVVAGAYSTTKSAQKKANILKKAGYSNASVIQRPGSKLFSALVERFDSESAAEKFAEELSTNNEIKSYVYKVEE